MTRSLPAAVLADLARSGLTAADAQKLGIVATDKSYRLPYFELSGEPNCFYRDRHLNRTEAKYTQEKGTTPRLYFPPLLAKPWSEIAKDTGQRLVLVEGEKKSASACKHGIAAVGIGGVWNWMSGKKPIPDLDFIDWPGREVPIAFDSDSARNPNVAQAREALACVVASRGAKVRIVTLSADGDAKVGVDDFIVAHGIDAFRRLCDSAPEFESWLAEMNKQYFFVSIGGKSLIGSEVYDPALDCTTLALSTAPDMRVKLANRFVQVGDKRVNLFEAWNRHPERGERKGIVFDPSGEAEGYHNLWKGFAVQPAQGECDLYLDHVLNVICAGNEDLANYVLSWLAHGVQRPSELPGTSLVARGGQGTGKGVFVNEYGRLFGRHFIRLTNPKHLTGNFNGHTKDGLVLFADEAFWAGDKTAEGTLKALITEDTRLLEFKGKDAFPIKNYTRLIVASNHEWVVPAGMDERRFLVLDVAGVHAQDHVYFDKLLHQMNNGGREALLHYLQNYDLSKVNLRVLPQTVALLETKIRSMAPAELFIYEMLRDGANNGANEWLEWVPCKALHIAYEEKMKRSKSRSSETELGMTLHRLIPGVQRKRRRVGKHAELNIWGHLFPPLHECRAAFEKQMRCQLPWDDAPTGGRGR